MKKISFVFIFLLSPLFLSSCNNVPNGTITLTQTDITLVEGEEAIVRYSTSNNQLCSSSLSDDSHVQLTTSAYTKYNQYIWVKGLKPGNSTVTVTANKCPAVTLSVTVKTDDNVKDLTDKSYTIAEAAPAIDEAIVDNYKTIYITPISGTSKPETMLNYLELENSSYDLTDYCITTYNSKQAYRYVFSNFETGYTYHDPENSGKNVTNANLEIRKQGMTKRTSLPIDSVSETKEIKNTDQLWWAVEHGYKPIFVDENSTAAQCYNKAREICLNYIGEGFSEIDKVRSLFDYMTSNMKYNNWVVDINANDDWKKYTDYFLEGPLLHNVGVCDAFSKTMALLGGIEQINTVTSQRLVRSFGYTNSAGHAWNYYSPDGETYYLVCPTWGQTTEDSAFGYSSIFSNYYAFMTKKSFFKDIGGSAYNFSDNPWKNISKSGTIYSDQTGLGTDPDASDLANKCSQISSDYVLNVVCSNLSKLDEYSKAFHTTSIYYCDVYSKYYAYIMVKK